MSRYFESYYSRVVGISESRFPFAEVASAFLVVTKEAICQRRLFANAPVGAPRGEGQGKEWSAWQKWRLRSAMIWFSNVFYTKTRI